jgi:hypothetical protein
MSTLLHTRQRITELLGILAYQAKAYSAAGHTDFNKVCEDVLVPLFRLVFNLPDLKNLNAEKKKNFPAIDLADDNAGIAFQVTATFESQKIKKSLETFVRKDLYKQYLRLIFYIITEKKDSYPEQAFADIAKGKFEFNVGRDIIDFRDLVKLCNQLPLNKASKIKRILEANFGRGDYSVFSEKEAEPFEEVSLNLIEAFFPDKLYLANLFIDRNEIIENARGALKRNDPTRTIIRHYIIEQLKLDFFSGWHLHGNQLITFHNLDDDTFLRKIIDEGSIASIKPDQFYAPTGTIDADKENVFKTLLRKTLQEQLYRQDVEWQFKEGLFIFIENGNEKETKKKVKRKKDGEVIEVEQIIFKRFETWVGEKESSRAVLERFMKSDKPGEVWYYKHRAFEARFKHISNKWFLLVLPNWFFSYDCFKKSRFHANDLKWLKRKSNTGIVFTDFRFIQFFLQNRGNDLLQSKSSTNLLRYGDIVSFENAPFLHDEAWNPPEEKKKKRKKKVMDVAEEDEQREQDLLFDV